MGDVAGLLQERDVPFAVIGAAAMAVHGVTRSTRDLDLRVVAAECLTADFWAPVRNQGVSVSLRRGGAECSGVTPAEAAASRPRYWTWATLMRRAFDLDVLACPRCGGRLGLIATVEEPGVVRTILAYLGLLFPPDSPGPAPPAPGGFAGATPQDPFERVSEA